ncbi:hypothetical protein NDU88_002811 [Pleurodeles waltl]|uniref:Uncharacterized protein n=1 Tax=Pleurodeles waltl TaxID=8319 RepID=A0AAV7UYS5_PLEWA|nr:hypothetical protein NDU88_002811 [Pleurodeles waltl]
MPAGPESRRSPASSGRSPWATAGRATQFQSRFWRGGGAAAGTRLGPCLGGQWRRGASPRTDVQRNAAGAGRSPDTGEHLEVGARLGASSGWRQDGCVFCHLDSLRPGTLEVPGPSWLLLIWLIDGVCHSLYGDPAELGRPGNAASGLRRTLAGPDLGSAVNGLTPGPGFEPLDVDDLRRHRMLMLSLCLSKGNEVMLL